MNFGMFTDFHVRQNMSQAEAFDESFRQVEAAEKLGIDSAAGRVVQGRPVAVVDDGEVSACAVHHDPAAAAVKTLEQQTGRAGRALHPMRSGHAS